MPRDAAASTGAFNAVAHTARDAPAGSGSGRYNIPNIGIFLWRLQPFRLTALPLITDPGDASGCKLPLNPLGADLRLFRRPRTEREIIAPRRAGQRAGAVDGFASSRCRSRDATTTVRRVAETARTTASVADSAAAASRALAPISGPRRRPDDPPPCQTGPEVRIADSATSFDGGGTSPAGRTRTNRWPTRSRSIRSVDGYCSGARSRRGSGGGAVPVTFHYRLSRARSAAANTTGPEEPDEGTPETSREGEALAAAPRCRRRDGGRLLVDDSVT